MYFLTITFLINEINQFRFHSTVCLFEELQFAWLFRKNYFGQVVPPEIKTKRAVFMAFFIAIDRISGDGVPQSSRIFSLRASRVYDFVDIDS